MTVNLKNAASTEEAFAVVQTEPLGGPIPLTWTNPAGNVFGVLFGFANFHGATNDAIQGAAGAYGAAAGDADAQVGGTPPTLTGRSPTRAGSSRSSSSSRRGRTTPRRSLSRRSRVLSRSRSWRRFSPRPDHVRCRRRSDPPSAPAVPGLTKFFGGRYRPRLWTHRGEHEPTLEVNTQARIWRSARSGPIALALDLSQAFR